MVVLLLVSYSLGAACRAIPAGLPVFLGRPPLLLVCGGAGLGVADLVGLRRELEVV